MGVFTCRDTKGLFVPDGLWAWVVCSASFILQFISIGSAYTFGIIFVEFLDVFHKDESVISWIGGIQFWLIYFTGVVAGPLLARFSWRAVTISGALISCAGFMLSALSSKLWILFLTYGVLTGIGNGLMYTTSMIVVQHYFEKRRAMASGITASGSGVGMIVFGYIQSSLIQEYGWKYAVIVIGAMCGVLGIACGCLYVPILSSISNFATMCEDDEQTAISKKSEKRTYGDIVNKEMDSFSDQDEGKKSQNYYCTNSCLDKIQRLKLFDLNLFKNPIFVFYVISSSTFAIGYSVSFTYIPEKALSLGLDMKESSFLISIIGFTNTASRIVFGWIADKGPQIRFYLMFVILCGKGAASVMIFLFNTHTKMILYALLFGVLTGCFVSLFPIFFVDHLGIDSIEHSLGQALAVMSFAYLFSPPLAGWTIQYTGNFDVLFLIVGIIELIGGILYFTIKFFFQKYGYKSMG